MITVQPDYYIFIILTEKEGIASAPGISGGCRYRTWRKKKKKKLFIQGGMVPHLRLVEYFDLYE